ncbi:MAG: hypothetical protein P4L40_02475 [Terracidiphilus sp.]|nr:hypothetical protein [Terracidiphilus sp.]
MAHETNSPGMGRIWAVLGPWTWSEKAYDWLYSEANIEALKQWAILVSIAGFVIHLVLIFLGRTFMPSSGLLAAAGHNYLSAISTPFNFILFYEVLTLIATMAASTTRSIAGQFEVVSLIFIRDVFHDIAATGKLTAESRPTPETLALFVHMWAGLVMFLLVALFRHAALRQVRSRETASYTAGLQRFIAQKKAVTVGLTTLLIVMAAYNLALQVFAVWSSARTGTPFVEPATTFYNDLFTVMIFTDVLVLILSLVVSGRYEMVFRNAAFVVAIILIRFALTETYPYGAALAVMAMAFSVLVVLLFNYHTRLTSSVGS